MVSSLAAETLASGATRKLGAATADGFSAGGVAGVSAEATTFGTAGAAATLAAGTTVGGMDVPVDRVMARMAVDGGDALVCLSSDPCLNVLRPKLSATTSKAAALPRIIIQRAPFCLEKSFGAMTLMSG